MYLIDRYLTISTGRQKTKILLHYHEFVQRLCGRPPTERLSRSVVQCNCDCLEIVRAVLAEVRARLLLVNGLFQGVQVEAVVGCAGHLPTDSQAGKGLDHKGRVQVRSASQTWFGAVALKFRWSLFGMIG